MDASPCTVGDVATRTVVAVSRDAGFKKIATTMKRWNVSALPVLEGDNRVIGVVSESDLLLKEEFRDSDPARFDELRRLADMSRAGAVTAEGLMTSPAVCVHADATLAQAARIMAQRNIGQLPVTDGENRLCGIVSRSDLLKVFLRTDEEIADEVRRVVLRPLFPGEPDVRVDVRDGVVTLHGRVPQRALIPVATRLARTVEGVVGVRCGLAQHDAGPQDATAPPQQ
ncbi:CBS domain-containing protein [Actinacidiphila alni]|uniref:CBS domain-containing protein n=1 Tax=Actinacidiphila alni TaxID=380248 RepID=UPI003406D6C9